VLPSHPTSSTARLRDWTWCADALYPAPEHHTLGLEYVPKISDFGLGKLVTDTPSLTLAGAAGGMSGGAGGSVLQAVGGTSSFAVHAAHRMGHGGRGGAGAGGGDVSSSNAPAPGSVGWQAPEIVRAIVHMRAGDMAGAGEGSPRRGVGSGGAGGDPDTPGSPGMGPTASDDAGAAASAAATVEPASGDRDSGWRRSSAADIWALGCVLYHVVDPGGHPYGEWYEREARIIHNSGSLSRIDHLPEMHALIAAMVQDDPALRPTAAVVAEHPALWDDEARMAFLQDLSDRLEREADGAPLVAALDARAPQVLGRSGSWDTRLPAVLTAETGRFRRYDFTSLADCLRFLRNKRNHYAELPPEVRSAIIGSDSPTALVPFFLAAGRLPRLLLAAYEHACAHMRHDPTIRRHLGAATVAWLDAVAPVVKPLPATASAVAATVSSSAPCTPVKTPATHAPTTTAPAPLTSHAGGPCRHWMLAEDAWHAAVDEVAHSVASATGGVLIPATVERPINGDGTPTSSPSLGTTPPGGSTHVMAVCAHLTSLPSLSSTKYKGGAHVTNQRYKSMLCADWNANAGMSCPRGVRCDFAHGPVEMRPARIPTTSSGGGGSLDEWRTGR